MNNIIETIKIIDLTLISLNALFFLFLSAVTKINYSTKWWFIGLLTNILGYTLTSLFNINLVNINLNEWIYLTTETISYSFMFIGSSIFAGRSVNSRRVIPGITGMSIVVTFFIFIFTGIGFPLWIVQAITNGSLILSTGFIIFRNVKSDTLIFSKFSGILFILWGFHWLDYPVLIKLQAPFEAGYMVAIVLANLAISSYAVLMIRTLINQLIKSERNLLTTNNRLEQLLTVVSHDFRAPLGSLLQHQNHILQSLNAGDINQAKKHITNIRIQGSIMYEQLENTLYWIQNQKNTPKLNIQTIDMKLLLDDVILLFKEIILTKNLRMDLDHKSFQRISIVSDWSLLTIILRNIIYNAIKFADKGGTVTIFVAPGESGIDLEVLNTGTIMKMETIESILNGKGKIKNSIKSKQNGFGIGLKLSLSLANLIHCNIIIKPETSVTRVIVKIPINF